ncbi:hypothetical protein [Halapricum salinum]|uniref:Uncharacterized protein n=1 Tax=Halapricum salinum TaxID=1457250 RepID=A0A4D6H7S1_9EURY|nr:hypothetical protein [Halapricum salinum]QCC49849.1 hypothetical protein DV733_00805 [Halapricum salinum]
MSDIRIYGSQGQPLDSETDSPDQRIKDFFFDGVRLAIQDRGTEVEATVFFRARESEASRSEQYYAVYRANSIRDIGRGFHADLVDLVEGKYGMELVTSTDDTTIFQLLVENEQGRTPTNTRDLDDLKTLLRDSQSSSLGGSSESTLGIKDEATTTGVQAPQPLKVGVGSYRLAFGVLLEVTADAGSVVIAENADSSRLSDFTIVIEEGPYNGVTLLGETEQAVQNLRERRRQRRQPAGAVASDPGLLDRHGTKVYGIAGVFGILALTVLALYGSALAGMPIVDGLPLMGGGDDGGDDASAPEVELQVDNSLYQNNRLSFSLSANDSLPQRAIVGARLSNQTRHWSNEWTVTDGSYTLTFDNATLDANSTYRLSVNVSYDNRTLSTETAVTPGNQSTSTPTPSSLDQVTIENAGYDSDNNDITFDLRNVDASLAGNTSMNVTRTTPSGSSVDVRSDVSIGGNVTESFPDTISEAGEHTLRVALTHDGESRTITKSFNVPEAALSVGLQFRQAPSYDPATRQVTFTLGNESTIPENATLTSNITDVPLTNHDSSRIGSAMNVTIGDGLDPGNYTLDVTLASATEESINETFAVTTRPLSVESPSPPTYDPPTRNVSFTLQSIGGSVPADANVTVDVMEGDSVRVSRTYSFGAIEGESQQLDPGILEAGQYGLEVLVEDPTFDAENETTVPFNVSDVYLGFSDEPSHNETTGKVTFGLTNEMHNRKPLPEEATMNVSVLNESGVEVFRDSSDVTNGKYPKRIDPEITDGHYDLMVTLIHGDQTYTVNGSFVNRKTDLAFADGPDYNATAKQVTFNMTNAADGFDLPEETTMNVLVSDDDSQKVSEDIPVTDGNYTASIDEVDLEKGTYNLSVVIDGDGQGYSVEQSFVYRNVSLKFSEGPEYNATSGEVAFNMTNAAAGFDLPEETTMVVEWLEDDFPTGDSTVVNVTDGAYNRSIAFDEDNGTYTANVTIEANGKHYSEEKPFVKRNVSLNVSYGPTYDESAGELRLNLTNDAENFSLPQTNRMAVSVTNTSGPVNATTLNVTNGNYNRSFPVTLDDSNYTVSVTIQRHSAPVTVSVDLTVGADEADQQNVARQFVARARAT